MSGLNIIDATGSEFNDNNFERMRTRPSKPPQRTKCHSRKTQVFSLSLARWPHLARVDSLREFRLISTNSRIYYAFPPALKMAEFGHVDATSIVAEVFYFQNASSAEPVSGWPKDSLKEGFK
jgi:hypothetical protein